MSGKIKFLLLALVIFGGCSSEDQRLANSFEVYCEMVANDAKPIALSPPMRSDEVSENWESFQTIAKKFDVQIFREKDFLVTPLFPSELTKGKEVVIIYRSSRLTQYLQLKQDLPKLEPEKAARRLGRLLGYSPQGINRLLMENTDFRTLESFQVNKQITHLYYEDVEVARDFYAQVLKLKEIEPNHFAIGRDASIYLHEFTDDHPEGQPQSTAIALLTDQLTEWYAYAQKQGIPIKYTYKPRDGGPHDGFVAIDPGGYLLEFEEFKQHPENELFMAALEPLKKELAKVSELSFYGSITWTYHNDLLKMQQFYEEVLGFRLVADQGWTKIYQTTSSGFIGLVDERRGMMDYADEKAVEIEWQLQDHEAATSYFSVSEQWNAEGQYLIGPENYRYQLR